VISPAAPLHRQAQPAAQATAEAWGGAHAHARTSAQAAAARSPQHELGGASSNLQGGAASSPPDRPRTLCRPRPQAFGAAVRRLLNVDPQPSSGWLHQPPRPRRRQFQASDRPRPAAEAHSSQSSAPSGVCRSSRQARAGGLTRPATLRAVVAGGAESARSLSSAQRSFRPLPGTQGLLQVRQQGIEAVGFGPGRCAAGMPPGQEDRHPPAAGRSPPPRSQQARGALAGWRRRQALNPIRQVPATGKRPSHRHLGQLGGQNLRRRRPSVFAVEQGATSGPGLFHLAASGPGESRLRLQR